MEGKRDKRRVNGRNGGEKRESKGMKVGGIFFFIPAKHFTVVIKTKKYHFVVEELPPSPSLPTLLTCV